MKTIKYKQVYTIQKPVKIDFKTKEGKKVSFKAIQIIKKGKNIL